MMHSNPLTDYGHDIRNLESKVSQKADSHEVSTLRSTLDRLEHSTDMGRDEHRREIDGIRSRLDRVEENQQRLEVDLAEIRSALAA